MTHREGGRVMERVCASFSLSLFLSLFLERERERERENEHTRERGKDGGRASKGDGEEMVCVQKPCSHPPSVFTVCHHRLICRAAVVRDQEQSRK